MKKSHTCQLCGKRHRVGRFGASTERELQTERLCFDCSFWKEAAANPNTFRVGRTVHTLGAMDKDAPAFVLGYGGACWVITKMDGTTIYHNNVWHRGTCPDHFLDKIPEHKSMVSLWEHNQRS